MVEKRVGLCFVPVNGLEDIRKGDVFRTTDGRFQGPLLVAQADAEQVPHPKNPEKLVWHVRTQR